MKTVEHKYFGRGIIIKRNPDSVVIKFNKLQTFRTIKSGFFLLINSNTKPTT